MRPPRFPRFRMQEVMDPKRFYEIVQSRNATAEVVEHIDDHDERQSWTCIDHRWYPGGPVIGQRIIQFCKPSRYFVLAHRDHTPNRFAHVDGGRYWHEQGYDARLAWEVAWRAIRRRATTGQRGILKKLHPDEPSPSFLLPCAFLRTARYLHLVRSK